jgi:hypothetical protein
VNGDVPKTDSVEVINMNAFNVKDVNDAAIPESKVKKNVPINGSAGVGNMNTFDINYSVNDMVITKMNVRKRDDVKTNFTLSYRESEDGNHTVLIK